MPREAEIRALMKVEALGIPYEEALRLAEEEIEQENRELMRKFVEVTERWRRG